VRSAEELPLSSALAHERSLFATVLATDDHREGIDAFLARRPPRFAGR
jgi:enoyl-CoA hydratase/carnithine racemase